MSLRPYCKTPKDMRLGWTDTGLSRCGGMDHGEPTVSAS